MSIIPLGPGEFATADKIQPAEYIQARTEKLRTLYGRDPELARDIISLIYPHAQKRPWEHTELQERLGLGEVAKAAAEVNRAQPQLFNKLAWSLLASQFPSVAAAMDAFQASRAQQEAQEAMMRGDPFPALHATQPNMLLAQQQAMYGGGMPVQQPVHHHRRHRHHSG